MLEKAHFGGPYLPYKLSSKTPTFAFQQPRKPFSEAKATKNLTKSSDQKTTKDKTLESREQTLQDHNEHPPNNIILKTDGTEKSPEWLVGALKPKTNSIFRQLGSCPSR